MLFLNKGQQIKIHLLVININIYCTQLGLKTLRTIMRFDLEPRFRCCVRIIYEVEV